jgi:hypothetical protein
MSYRVNRSLGYQPAYVMNPWVWANYGQPQRLRGQVSPMVAQTVPPYLTNWHLGEAGSESAPAPALTAAELREQARDARAMRMELLGFTGVTIALISLMRSSGSLKPNRRRRRTR